MFLETALVICRKWAQMFAANNIRPSVSKAFLHKGLPRKWQDSGHGTSRVFEWRSIFIIQIHSQINKCQDTRKLCIKLMKHRPRWIAYAFHTWPVAEDLVLFEKLQANNHSMQSFSHFRKNTSYNLHMWRQYCHLLKYNPSLVYLPSISPSRRRPFCFEKILRVQVPLCVSRQLS